MGKKVLFLVVLAFGVFGFAQTASAQQTVEPTALDEIVFAPDFTEEEADVLRLYYAFFNRAPDPSGARYWLEQHDNGLSLDDIAFWFSQGVEFQRNYDGTSNEQFVTRVYQNVLGRAPDTSGFNYWRAQLVEGNLDRAGVVRFVSANLEFERRRPLPDGRRLAVVLASAENFPPLWIDLPDRSVTNRRVTETINQCTTPSTVTRTFSSSNTVRSQNVTVFNRVNLYETEADALAAALSLRDCPMGAVSNVPAIGRFPLWTYQASDRKYIGFFFIGKALFYEEVTFDTPVTHLQASEVLTQQVGLWFRVDETSWVGALSDFFE